MRRTPTFRLATAFAAIIFAATGGITGMEVHPRVSEAAGSEAHAEHQTVSAAHTPDGGAHAHHGVRRAEHTPATQVAHASHEAHPPSHDGHAGHEGHHPPGQECTCVGPCQGGAAPSLGGPATSGLALADPERAAATAAPARLIHQDPRSHLLPLANAPPARV